MKTYLVKIKDTKYSVKAKDSIEAIEKAKRFYKDSELPTSGMTIKVPGRIQIAEDIEDLMVDNKIKDPVDKYISKLNSSGFDIVKRGSYYSVYVKSNTPMKVESVDRYGLDVKIRNISFGLDQDQIDGWKKA